MLHFPTRERIVDSLLRLDVPHRAAVAGAAMKSVAHEIGSDTVVNKFRADGSMLVFAQSASAPPPRAASAADN